MVVQRANIFRSPAWDAVCITSGVAQRNCRIRMPKNTKPRRDEIMKFMTGY
ncbi:MAG: hypothetical protein LBJ00_14060 [Planctomycetaceae bacterium]|nr:hypothetical protein [Planctomycetaceae bacterium]